MDPARTAFFVFKLDYVILGVSVNAMMGQIGSKPLLFRPVDLPVIEQIPTPCNQGDHLIPAVSGYPAKQLLARTIGI
jgi:hypothetical protein